MSNQRDTNESEEGFRIHNHWIIIFGGAALLALVTLLISSLDKLDAMRSSHQSEIADMTSRISEAEQRITVLEKSNSFAKAALAKEAEDERIKEQRAQELERLRADQRLIESNQQMLCDATGDC